MLLMSVRRCSALPNKSLLLPVLWLAVSNMFNAAAASFVECGLLLLAAVPPYSAALLLLLQLLLRLQAVASRYSSKHWHCYCAAAADQHRSSTASIPYCAC
jgi:hypothetical protein